MTVLTEINQKIINFFSTYPPEQHASGTILIEAGQAPRGVMYLETGTIKTYAISIIGDETILNQFKAGAFLPMAWAINQTPNPYYYAAQTDIIIRTAPAGRVVQFIKENPDILFDLLSRVYRGSDGLLMRMNYLLTGNKYANVVTELLITAKRFGKPGESPDSLIVHINQQQIASQSGMARETVSREMAKLKTKGLIQFHKNQMIIPSVTRLEAELTAA
jgi:CRP-like cAMP-binding protein